MKRIILIIIVLFFITGCKDDKAVTDNGASFRSGDYLVEVDSLPGVVGGMAELQKNLIYPSEAKAQGIEGKVVVKVFLNEAGEVVNTEVIKSDNKLLEQSAIDALERTKFTPGIVKGESVKTQIAIPIVFKLDENHQGEKKENKYPEYLQEVDEFPMPVGGIQALAQNIVYPSDERKNGIQGQVLVLAMISEAGDVIKTEVVKGVTANLDKAAMDAINKTKFLPAKKDGIKVKAQVQIPVSFKLN